MAFKIIINGITADLKGASKQELVFQNPIFDYEAMTGSYGLPFSLPFSKTNDRIFNNARSEFSTGMPLTYLCEQYLNDGLVAEGLIVLSDTNGAYNCNFTSNLRDIFTPVSGSVRYDGYLRDILPAGPDVSSFALRNAMTTWNSIVCYPTILNDQFYGANAPGGWNNEVNSYNGTTYQNTTFVPAVSIWYILEQIEAYYGITINGTFTTDSGYSQFVIMHNSAEDGAATANLKLSVGDLTVAGFINELRNTIGLTGDIDLLSKKITLNYCQAFFDAEVASDWSSFCSKIIAKTASPYTGIELDYTADTEDKNYTDSTLYTKYKSTAPSGVNPDAIKNRIIKSNLSPIALTGTSFPSKITQNGKTTVNGQGTKSNRPRIGFYRGLTLVGAINIPTIGPLSPGTLQLRTDTGIVRRKEKLFATEETFWKNTFEASFKINLRKISLSGFDIKSKVHIHGWNYLIKRIVMDCNNPENSLLEAYRA